MNYKNMKIRLFFSAYLYQGWDAEYETINEAISDYCSCGELSDRLEALNELKNIIYLSKTEGFTKSDLRAVGCFYFPLGMNLTLTEWLIFLESNMESELKLRELSIKESKEKDIHKKS